MPTPARQAPSLLTSPTMLEPQGCGSPPSSIWTAAGTLNCSLSPTSPAPAPLHSSSLHPARGAFKNANPRHSPAQAPQLPSAFRTQCSLMPQPPSCGELKSRPPLCPQASSLFPKHLPAPPQGPLLLLFPVRRALLSVLASWAFPGLCRDVPLPRSFSNNPSKP